MTVVLLAMVGMLHVDELQARERRLLRGLLERAMFRRELRQRNAKFFDFLQGYTRAAKERETADNPGQRPHEIQRRDDITCQCFMANGCQVWHQEENQTNEAKIQEVIPVLRNNETDFSGDVMPLVGFGCAFDIAVERGASATV